MAEAVNHPAHYNTGNIEAIDLIEDWGCMPGFAIGNALKYICRAPHKGSTVEDLRKAVWYLRRAHAYVQQNGSAPPLRPLYHYLLTPAQVAKDWKLPDALDDAVERIYDGQLEWAAVGLEAYARKLEEDA